MTLPEFFTVLEMKEALANHTVKNRFQPTLGLIHRLRSGSKRYLKMLSANERGREGDEVSVSWRLFQVFVDVEVSAAWSSASFRAMVEELVGRCHYLPPDLIKKLDDHILYPADDNTSQPIVFDSSFKALVRAYLARVTRSPDVGEKTVKRKRQGSVSADDSKAVLKVGIGNDRRRVDQDNHEGEQQQQQQQQEEEEAKMVAIISKGRLACRGCGKRRAVYCGECLGLRVGAEGETDHLLPLRVVLPFEVLLVVHHREQLASCTGVHVGALAEEGSLTVHHWARCDGYGVECASDDFIRGLDPGRHVLLFPGSDAVRCSLFPWTMMRDGDDKGDANGGRPTLGKRCLVVLEANWTEGVKMAKRIARVRDKAGLAQVPSVTLDVSATAGSFWKFQDLGKGCVSTIEAIAETARGAGLPREDVHAMLFLFRLQKRRVMETMADKCAPIRAYDASGGFCWD